MRFEDIRELLRRQPFRPFRVLLTNHLSYEIRHPELVAVTRSTRQIAFPSQSAPGNPHDRVVGISLLHIVQYEIFPPVAPPTSN